MIERIYRTAILPAFESKLKGRMTFSCWHQLEQSQWWSANEHHENQSMQLRRLLAFCQGNSRWYHDQWKRLGVHVDSVESVDDLQQLPILERETVRDHGDVIRVNDAGQAFVSKSTGGSSGTPLRLTISKSAEDRRVAATFRGYSWAGGSPGTRQSYLWGVRLNDATRLRKWKDHIYNRLLYRRDMLNSFEFSDSTAQQYLNRINQFRPDTLVAYTGPLYAFSKLILQHDWKVWKPKAIIVGAEKLHVFQRQTIEQAFATRVFETYGSREFTLIGAECSRHSGLHLTSENLIVEVVDEQGRPAQAGQEGRILITDLHNYSTPLVRYAIGDRAIAGFSQCDCGRGLPLLRKVVGRELDVLQLPDGKRIAGEFFPHLLKDFPAIRQYQIVQARLDEIHLKLVIDPHKVSSESLAQVRDQTQKAIGHSARCVLKIVDQIELTTAGKSRVVIKYPDVGTSRPELSHDGSSSEVQPMFSRTSS
jgi:phenylacetate-CoA ligase